MISFAVFAGLIAMLASGLGTALIKQPTVELGPLQTIVWRNVIAVPFLAILFFAVGSPLDFSQGSIAVGFGIAVASYFPFMFFMLGLEREKVGVIMPIASGRIIVSAVFGFLLLGDTMTVEKLVAIAVIFSGIFVGTINWRDFKNSDFLNLKSGVPYAIIAALLGTRLPARFFDYWHDPLPSALRPDSFRGRGLLYSRLSDRDALAKERDRQRRASWRG